MTLLTPIPTADATRALHRLAAVLGWGLEQEGPGTYTLVLPGDQGRIERKDVATALSYAAYIATWRRDREDVRGRVNWLGPASDVQEGPRGDSLRWLVALPREGSHFPEVGFHLTTDKAQHTSRSPWALRTLMGGEAILPRTESRSKAK